MPIDALSACKSPVLSASMAILLGAKPRGALVADLDPAAASELSLGH